MVFISTRMEICAYLEASDKRVGRDIVHVSTKTVDCDSETKRTEYCEKDLF